MAGTTGTELRQRRAAVARTRRMRGSRLVGLTLVFAVLLAGVALGDAIQQLDGSVDTSGNDIRYVESPGANAFACSVLRDATESHAVGGDGRVARTGTSPNFTGSQTLGMSGEAASGITVTGFSPVTLPSDWGPGSSAIEFTFTTNVPKALPDGEYTVTIRATGALSSGTGTAQSTFTVIVDCDSEEADPLEITAFSLGHLDACTVEAEVAWDGGVAPFEVEFEWGDDSQNTVVPDLVETTATASHTYDDAGTFEVTATVTDDEGEFDAASESFTTMNAASDILEPIKANGASSFKTKQSVPVKITVTDCDGSDVEDLSPSVALRKLDNEPDVGLVADSEGNLAPTNGKQMTWNGEHYHYVLSTQKSQFNNGNALSPGTYEIKITDPTIFGSAKEQFQLRK